MRKWGGRKDDAGAAGETSGPGAGRWGVLFAQVAYVVDGDEQHEDKQGCQADEVD